MARYLIYPRRNHSSSSICGLDWRANTYFMGNPRTSKVVQSLTKFNFKNLEKFQLASISWWLGIPLPLAGHTSPSPIPANSVLNHCGFWPPDPLPNPPPKKKKKKKKKQTTGAHIGDWTIGRDKKVYMTMMKLLPWSLRSKLYQASSTTMAGERAKWRPKRKSKKDAKRIILHSLLFKIHEESNVWEDYSIDLGCFSQVCLFPLQHFQSNTSG